MDCFNSLVKLFNNIASCKEVLLNKTKVKMVIGSCM